MAGGKLWILTDRFGNEIYLTLERWAHIIDPNNHPEVEPFAPQVRETIQRGRRKQDAFDARGWEYSLAFSNLPLDYTHLVVCVRFRRKIDAEGNETDEKFVTTAYFQTRV